MKSFRYKDQIVTSEDGKTVLEALMDAGFQVPHACMIGACQSCLMKTVASLPVRSRLGLSDPIMAQGGFLACQTPVELVNDISRFSEVELPSYEGWLVDRRHLTSRILHLSFSVPGLELQLGKFVRVRTASGFSRAFCIATSGLETRRLLELHVRMRPGGEMSELLERSAIGDRFEFEGPHGRCAYVPGDPSRKVILIGSGTGLAPLYAIATDALSQGHSGPIHLYLGATQASKLYYQTELDGLRRQFPNFHLTFCLSRSPSDPTAGGPLETALLHHRDLTGAQVVLCGHPNLVRAGQRACFLAGASLRDISLASFAPSGSPWSTIVTEP